MFALILTPMRSDGTIFGFSQTVLILLFVAAVMLVGTCWQLADMWIRRTRGRNWPTVSAVIDLVSVAFMEDSLPTQRDGSGDRYYLATLTYTYKNPEEQIGEYSRSFGDKSEAQAWANSYKGETVKVHVDPRDPTRSVLREEDL